MSTESGRNEETKLHESLGKTKPLNFILDSDNQKIIKDTNTRICS